MAFRLYTLLGEETAEEEAAGTGTGTGTGAGAAAAAAEGEEEEGQSRGGISEALFLRFVEEAQVKPPHPNPTS